MAMWTTLISLIDPTAGGAEEKTAVETASAGKVEGNGEYDTTLQSIGSTLEVDYVKNPTPLYKKVQQEDWTAVANFLDAGYWPGSFFPDPVSPADQARTWVTHFDENDEDKFHWSILPLHLAIMLDAPFTTIRRLVELYPDSVRCTDDQNMLPLHIAMRHGSSNRVVDFLFCAFPEALNAKGKNDLTPLDCAIQGKDIVRARILNTFIEKSNDKATEIAASQFTEKIASLKERVRSKECALGDARSRLEVLEDLNALVVQLRESDLKNDNNSDNFKEVWLQREEEEPKKEDPRVKEVPRTQGKNLEQHIQLHPDRLSRGIQKITNSFRRLGGKDKTEVIKSSASMSNFSDKVSSIGHSKSWHPSKNNDNANAKSKADPKPSSARQGSGQSSPRTELSASDHGSLYSLKWPFLKGTSKERSDPVARQNSKASQRTRTYSEGNIIRHRSKDLLQEKPKEKSKLPESEPFFVHQADEKAFPKSSPEKTEEDQREPSDTKETNVAEGQTAVEGEKGGDNERVKEQVSKYSGGKMADNNDNWPVKEANENAETEKAANTNPLSSHGEKGIPATTTSDAAMHDKNVIYYKHSRCDLDRMVSVDQVYAIRSANVDKCKETIMGVPRSETKVKPKENIEYKDSARRHHLRLKQKEETKKSILKKQQESNKTMGETGVPKESIQKNDTTAPDTKKIPQFSQGSNSIKETLENLPVNKNIDSLKEKIKDPSAHRHSTQKHLKKVARSSSKVKGEPKESASKVKCEPNESTSKAKREPKESTSKVKRDRSRSRSKTRRPSEEKWHMSERRQQSSKANGDRSKSERREPASSTDNNRRNSLTTRHQSPSPQQGSNDVVPMKKSTPSRIDAIMLETASVQPEDHHLVTQTPKKKPSSKAKTNPSPPSRSRRYSVELAEVEVAEVGVTSSSDSHSDGSSTYSSDEDDDSISVFSEDDGTGSSISEGQSLTTGSSCSSTTPSEDSESWIPWKVWSMQ